MEEQGQKEDTDIIENIENKVLSINDKAELRSFSEQTNIIEKKIPNFNIERIERLSGAFNQGKIFLLRLKKTQIMKANVCYAKKSCRKV